MLTILTINIHKGFSWLNRRFTLPKLREAIRSTKADIVFLQEVTGENILKELKHTEWPNASHYEYLAEEQWPFFTYGKNAIYPHGHHGNALLSRLPIVSSSNTNISTNKQEHRGLLYACITVPTQNKPVHCLCVHLNLFRGGRKKQFTLLEQFIQKNIPANEPLVLAGDFNDWRNTDVLSFSNDIGLTDAVCITTRKKVRTFPAWLPLAPLDHIFIRNAIVKQSTRHTGDIWCGLSDHAAISATIDIG